MPVHTKQGATAKCNLFSFEQRLSKRYMNYCNSFHLENESRDRDSKLSSKSSSFHPVIRSPLAGYKQYVIPKLNREIFIGYTYISRFCVFHGYKFEWPVGLVVRDPDC